VVFPEPKYSLYSTSYWTVW